MSSLKELLRLAYLEETMTRSDPPEGPPSERPERRTEVRHLACFPADLQTNTTALIRDLSVSGAFLLTRVPMKIGEAIRLSLYLVGEQAAPVVADGRVVRHERRSSDCDDVWQYSVGVQFDSPLNDYQAEIQALASKQATLGFFPKDY